MSGTQEDSRWAEGPNRYGAFLLYVDDWLSSTAIEMMTAAEERGYLRLLMHAWKSPDCGLPKDDKTLAQLSKLGGAWRGKGGGRLRAQFFERDGRLFNERLLRERQHQLDVRLSRSKASRKANAARWNPSRNPPRSADGSISDPNPNPNPRSTEHDSLISSYIQEELPKKRNAALNSWEVFKSLYPPHRLDEERACAAFISREEEADAILAGVRAAMTTDAWNEKGGKFVPKASRFISERLYLDATRAVTAQQKTAPTPYFDPKTITG